MEELHKKHESALAHPYFKEVIEPLSEKDPYYPPALSLGERKTRRGEMLNNIQETEGRARILKHAVISFWITFGEDLRMITKEAFERRLNQTAAPEWANDPTSPTKEALKRRGLSALQGISEDIQATDKKLSHKLSFRDTVLDVITLSTQAKSLGVGEAKIDEISMLSKMGQGQLSVYDALQTVKAEKERLRDLVS